MMEFGDKIREARKNKELTQRQFADLIGAKHNSVSNWENNQNKPDPDTIEKICGVLDISPSYLLGTKKPQPTISEFEKVLLSYYNQLNDLGKEKLIENAEDLTHNIKYSNVVELPKIDSIEGEKDYLKPIAAHNDNQNEPEQQQLIKKDLAKLRAKKISRNK